MNASAADRLWLLGIPVAAAIAIAPLADHGPSYGHDFHFHLLNWMEAVRQFAHGTLYPRWAFSAAFNAGEPRFVFYPPLSWTLGALIGLLLTHIPRLSAEGAWAAAPILYTWICLTTSGLTMYRAARAYSRPGAALLASVVYILNPYMLFTAYERTAYAELLAAAWMPLLLAALLLDELRAREIAIPIALLWLTNAPAAVIGCYTLAVIALLRMIRGAHEHAFLTRIRRNSRLIALPVATGALLGVGLAAIYFVPAAYERQFVQVGMAIVGGARVDKNFLFEHTGASPDARMHDAVLGTASWIAVTLMAAATIALLLCWKNERKQPAGTPAFPLGTLAALFAVSAFLLTTASNPIWQHTPELPFLQFPWRLLTLIAPVFALAFAAAMSQVRLRAWVVVASASLSAALLTFICYGQFRQYTDPDESVSASLQGFEQNQGTDPTDEYTPQTADNDALQPGDPPYWLASQATAAPPSDSRPGTAPQHLNLTTPAARYLILNLRDYPAWTVMVNGRVDTDRVQRDDGLIALALPAGRAKIDIRYRRMPDEIVGDALTPVSLLIVVLLEVRRRRASLSRAPAA